MAPAQPELKKVSRLSLYTAIVESTDGVLFNVPEIDRMRSAHLPAYQTLYLHSLSQISLTRCFANSISTRDYSSNSTEDVGLLVYSAAMTCVTVLFPPPRPKLTNGMNKVFLNIVLDDAVEEKEGGEKESLGTVVCCI